MRLRIPLSFLAPLASTIPLQRRDNPGGIYMCTKPDFGGFCSYAISPWGVCNTINHDWATSQSWGPDRGQTCTSFTDADCKGSWQMWQFPGVVVASFYWPIGANATTIKCAEKLEDTIDWTTDV
jgi:hypothetical protein